MSLLSDSFSSIHNDSTLKNSVAKKTIVALFVCTTLTGCVNMAKPRTDEAKAATIASLPDLPSQWATMQESIGAVDVNWLAQLNDPLLNRLVAEAQLNNKSLQAAAASVDGARALANQSASALSPQLGVSAGSTSGGSVEGNGSNDLNVGLQASWEADLWGRIRSGNLAAQQSVAAAEAEYTFAQYSIAANVAKAYFLAIEANQQLEIAQRSIDIVAETNRIVQVQYENGFVDSQNIALAKADLASANDGMIASEAGKRDALRALEVLLGRYPSAELGIANELPKKPQITNAGIPSQVLERRPDIIAAERKVAAAFNSVDAARAAKLPSLSLSSSLGGTSTSLSDILNPSNLAWQAIGNIAAPLIDGGLIDAQIDAATADQRAAIASYAQSALTAFADVEQALDQGDVLVRREEALTSVLNESEKAFNIAKLQYEEGEISLLDMLSIQQRVFTARSNLLSIKRASLSQFVDLNLALGGSW